MGFFSQECRGCEHSAISTYAASGKNDWMIDIVALFADGSLVQGEYDGYGRIETATGQIVENGVGFGAEIWHKACWVASGSPTTFEVPSPDSGDQGYFFDDDGYAHSAPASPADVLAIARKRDRE